MKFNEVNPCVNNFIKSLRDIGYTFEIAVADILDNSISAMASEIKIYAVHSPEIIFAMVDNGVGMTEAELIEAMRLASRDPYEKRENNDLGRFGLGLKTASFSQCKKMTVVSKKNGKINARQWDLDFISKKNRWLLIEPNSEEIEKLPLYQELLKNKSGTLVVWENIDRYTKESFIYSIEKLRKHLALVFHRFIEGVNSFNKLKIEINNNKLKEFNPFNHKHPATQQFAVEKIRINSSDIEITPYILPHHSKVSSQEYNMYGMDSGYVKGQGFYLYRGQRLLIYGTWWGLHKAIDAHKLVRIKIDIPNNMDHLWRIDVKKSSARPTSEIKKRLKDIIKEITSKGSRPYTGRGRKIKDTSVIRFWNLIPYNDEIRFGINREHPLYEGLKLNIADEQMEIINLYLKAIEAYIPLEAIQAQLQQNPHKIKQDAELRRNEIQEIIDKLRSKNFSDEYIDKLLNSEMFKEM